MAPHGLAVRTFPANREWMLIPLFFCTQHTPSSAQLCHFIMIIITPSVRLEVFAVYVRNPTWLGFFLLDQKKASPNKVRLRRTSSGEGTFPVCASGRVRVRLSACACACACVCVGVSVGVGWKALRRQTSKRGGRARLIADAHWTHGGTTCLLVGHTHFYMP